MKTFSIDAGMTNMRGVFYPTGHMVLMFPTERDARRACELLRHDGVSEDDLCLAQPAEFERQISDAIDAYDDVLLPSVGTEVETARRFRHLAHQGHHAEGDAHGLSYPASRINATGRIFTDLRNDTRARAFGRT